MALTGACIDQCCAQGERVRGCANNEVEKVLLKSKLLIIRCYYNTQKIVLLGFVGAI